MTQKDRILEILLDGNWHSNIEIHESTGIYRYGARIFELGKEYKVETKVGKKPYYYYRLVSKQGQIKMKI